MFQVIKKVQINGREIVRVLTEEMDFVAEQFIGDKNSITGPHNAWQWKTRRGAEKNARRFGGEVRLARK
jgi:hypothetical protein